MLQLRDLLHLDSVTVTGRTLGENLEEIERSKFFIRERLGYLKNYEGPRAHGMPELYFAASLLAADPALSSTTAIVTDGRYSGAMKGTCIGHVTPEALDAGPDRAGRGERPDRAQRAGAAVGRRRGGRPAATRGRGDGGPRAAPGTVGAPSFPSAG